jgi:putative Mg2+ transporter-C (MgtC) family protein
MASFDPYQLIDAVVAITAAYVLAVPLGWERKVEGGTEIGLRTLPLVAVGACGYLLLSRYLFENDVFDADGPARALRAMMTGIGFIGGGAILKHASGVKGVLGVTTATTVWIAGAIGASVAHGHYVVAAALSLTSVLVVQISGGLAHRARAARAADRAR